MPGVKKHPVVPRPEGVIGIRDSGDGHTPVTTKACEECFISLGHGRAGEHPAPCCPQYPWWYWGGVWNARQERTRRRSRVRGFEVRFPGLTPKGSSALRVW